MSRIVSLDTQDVELICLCFVGDASAAQVSYAARRLRRKMPKAFVMVALVGGSGDLNEDFKSSAGIEAVQHTLVGTRDEILKVVRNSSGAIQDCRCIAYGGINTRLYQAGSTSSVLLAAQTLVVAEFKVKVCGFYLYSATTFRVAEDLVRRQAALIIATGGNAGSRL